MSAVKDFLSRIRIGQWVLIAAGVLACVTALIVGVADNLPGIISLYIGLTFLAGAWVWNWPSPRDYWTLLVISIAAFPVSVVLHNMFYALASLVNEARILVDLLGFLDALFFLTAVMVVGPTALVSLIGGIYSSWNGMGKLTLKNRSVRRFKEKYPLKEKTLWKLLNLARQSASGANRQPLKFILSNTEDKNDLIFSTLSWAGYLKDWQGPVEGERPAAYIVLLGDNELANSFQYDAGIASQSITLGAAEFGLGACLIGSIKRDSLRKALSIPDQYEILLVIALGKPGERVVLEDIREDGDIRYWRDVKEVHHVPKRGLEELILDL